MKNSEMNIFKLAAANLEKINASWDCRRSAFGRGVTVYTADLMSNIGENSHELPDSYDSRALELLAQNGAGTGLKSEAGWRHYSESGSPLAYTEDIMKNFLTEKQFNIWKTTTKLDKLDAMQISFRGCLWAWERVRKAFKRAYEEMNG